MQEQLIGLNNCDIEPIHTPGQIQSHGFLIVLDNNLTITHHSENIHDFLSGVPEVLIGASIRDIEPVIGKNEPQNFIHQLITFGKVNGFDQNNPFHTDIQGKSFYLIISASASHYLLEFEPVLSDLKTDVQKLIGRSVSEMLADKDISSLLVNTASQVKNVIGYDRVMVYRFAPDGHGEVVSEAKNDDLEPFLGLHYPASDIPKQARELYKLNLTRLIANVNTTPSKIVSARQFSDQLLDLTNSQLRAVSPVHIQYLKNMGVHSSFSISLMYKGELWGLIACHNYSPRFIDFKARESAKLIGQILSSALEFRQDEANKHLQDRFNANVDALSKLMLKHDSIEEALTAQYVSLLDTVNATGALLVYENNVIKLGKTPDDEQIKELIKWIGSSLNETFYYTNELSAVFPTSAAYKHVAGGIMVLTLSHELSEYIIWFKPERIETITWAGNPDKPVEVSTDGVMKLTPRQSFEAWTQQVAGKSEPWTDEEIKSAMRLKAEVTYAINQKAGAIRMLNERLKQAYEELDTFSFTISHDLKNPLSTIKGYAQILTRDASLQPRVKDTLLRINDRVDKMNLMINEVLEYSRIGRQDIQPVQVDLGSIINDQIKDLKIAFNMNELNVVIGKTPTVQGDPVMLSQVFANLLSNAIKYSMEQPDASIYVDGREDEAEVIYSIKDNGVGIDIKQLPRIFELFKRMDNVQHIEGSGVGLAIVKRIVEKHNGKIWVDSKLGEGSTFFVAFKK